jgi:hypothetical protein
MEIIGKKNLELTKRALMSHLVYCSHHALRSSDSVARDKWDPEIKEVNTLLDAVEHNLKRITETGEDPNTGNGIVYTVGR